MLEFLWSAGAFIVAVGFLVAFHEWGHFWTARRLGVDVLRFSIGFGPIVARRYGRDGVEYALSAIPLGGYVKMLDEREGNVPPERAHRAFNRQKVWRRIAIVVAGPLANFIFAVVAYWGMFVVGQEGIRPVIGPVPVESRAHAAGLRGGEEILAIGDTPIRVWDELRPALLSAALDQATVKLRVRDGDAEQSLALDLDGVPVDPQTVFAAIGIDLPQPHYAPIIGQVLPDEPAARAGLASGDRITALNGEAVGSWQALRDWVRAHPGEIVEVALLRDGEPRQVELLVGSSRVDDQRVGRIGAGVAAQPELWQDLRLHWRLSPVEAVPAAIAHTGQMAGLTLQMLARMVTGEVSVRNISGPIHIAEYAGATATVGVVAFLSFMAIISISLGVLNLLPIPVLDGGHLLYYLVEWVKGSPVSERVQLLGQQVGMAALLCLMGLAFYNDIVRLMS